MGSRKNHKYIAKIGKRYFYTTKELNNFKMGKNKKRGEDEPGIFANARKATATTAAVKIIDNKRNHRRGESQILKNRKRLNTPNRKSMRYQIAADDARNKLHRIGRGPSELKKNQKRLNTPNRKSVAAQAKTTSKDTNGIKNMKSVLKAANDANKVNSKRALKKALAQKKEEQSLKGKAMKYETLASKRARAMRSRLVKRLRSNSIKAKKTARKAKRTINKTTRTIKRKHK